MREREKEFHIMCPKVMSPMKRERAERGEGLLSYTPHLVSEPQRCGGSILEEREEGEGKLHGMTETSGGMNGHVGKKGACLTPFDGEMSENR